MLLRESQVQPLLLVFEDLHWIDTETQALLDSLVESLPTARLLLLVNYRPEYQHGWGSKTYYTQLRLDPLPPASADAFLQALLGDDPSLAPLKQLLIERTEGNPFFLEESVRTLVETGVLVGEPGAYRLAQALPTIQVPATVQAVLAARIDRLPPEEKHLLQTAAVIGTEVPLPLLQAIAELPEAALHRGLAHLQAAEFLYETRLFPEHAYTFKHALTHEVAYGSLLQERRRVAARPHCRGPRDASPGTGWPSRSNAWRTMPCGARCGTRPWRTAGRRGRRPWRGRPTARPWGTSSRRSVPSRICRRQRDTREQAIDLRLALRSALRRLATLGVSWRTLREAESLAAALDDPRRLGQVSVFLSVHFYLMGAYDQAIAAAQRALALATAGGDVVLQALANLLPRHRLPAPRATIVGRSTASGRLWRSSTGRGAASASVRSSCPPCSPVPTLAWCHAELGTFAEGRALGDEGLRIAEAVAHPGSLMCASWGIGLLALRQGDLPRALPLLERAMGICQDADLPVFFPWMAAALGAAYTLGGRVADAVPLLTQAMEQTTATDRVGLSGALSSLPGGGAAAGWPPGGGARPRRAGAGARPCAPGTRQPGVCPAPPRRHCGAARASGGRAGRQPTTARPSPWPRSSACARSRPTATSASARCMPRPASGSRPAPSCLRLSSCTVPWR